MTSTPWPFPPVTGPVPWTQQQIAAYRRQAAAARRSETKQAPDAPF